MDQAWTWSASQKSMSSTDRLKANSILALKEASSKTSNTTPQRPKKGLVDGTSHQNELVASLKIVLKTFLCRHYIPGDNLESLENILEW